MAVSCCCCKKEGGDGKNIQPVICLVPRSLKSSKKSSKSSGETGGRILKPGSDTSDLVFMDHDYIKKHFNLPQRAIYLDPNIRPLICPPATEEFNSHFNMYKKTKINQMILDGILPAGAAITAPSVFPYDTSKSGPSDSGDEEIIYIMQLPDWEHKCPVHQTAIRTPRFIWHSVKKSSKKTTNERVRGAPKRPKPWVLSMLTDCDLLSQW